MKKLKLGAACMAAVMTVSLALTGCGGASSTSQPASSTAPSSTSASSTAPVEGADWLVPFDETVTLDVVVGWDADPSVKEGTTPETNALVEVAKDLLNIELNFLWMVPNDQLQEKLALQISSGEIPDIVMLQSADFYEFMDSDYLRDLTDAYNTYASDDLRSAVEGFGDAAIEYSSRDGKLYGIPAQLDTAESVAGLYYRSDILEAAGLSVPTNTQEMNDMLVALAQAGAVAILSRDKFRGKLAFFGGIKNAKFRSQVTPGDTLRLCVELEKLGSRAGTAKGTAYLLPPDGGKDGEKPVVACQCEIMFVIG